MRTMKDSGIEWIGEIPKSWTITILSALFSERKCKNRGLAENNLLSLSYGNIVRKNIESNEGLLPASFETYNIIEPGNIVFRLTDLQNDKRSLRTGLCQERGIITSAYVTLQIRSNDSPRYMHYLFHTYDLCKVFYGMGDGVRQGMNYEDLKRLRILRPDQETQRRIADYLDRKCSQIDTIIARQQEVIEKLKAYKLSVITEAVTKGLNPNVPMKDSGVEWIGEIPASWRISTLGALSESIQNGYVGPTKNIFMEKGIRYIQSLHIKDGKINFNKHEYYVSQEWGQRHPKLHTGDLLIVQTGDIGQVGLVTHEYDGCNCHALIIVKLKTHLLLPAFSVFYFLSKVGKELLLATKTGATLPHLNSGKIKFSPVCVPPVEEQSVICDFLCARCQHIDQIILRKENEINLLKRYQSSLIYEVVTGKKEV